MAHSETDPRSPLHVKGASRWPQLSMIRRKQLEIEGVEWMTSGRGQQGRQASTAAGEDSLRNPRRLRTFEEEDGTWGDEKFVNGIGDRFVKRWR